MAVMATPLHLIIFGASGDLTARKLIPALFGLWCKSRLPEDLHVIGVARSPLSSEQFRKKLADGVRESAPADWSADGRERWQSFVRRLHYVSGDAAKPGGLDALRSRL